jgi:hypothetical protein
MQARTCWWLRERNRHRHRRGRLLGERRRLLVVVLGPHLRWHSRLGELLRLSSESVLRRGANVLRKMVLSVTHTGNLSGSSVRLDRWTKYKVCWVVVVILSNSALDR